MPNERALRACGAWCATAQLEDGSFLAVPLCCRQWDCPSCARQLKRRLLRRLAYARPNLFVTLTSSERTAAEPTAAYERINQAIAPLIKRWRRKFPAARVEYFLVWERTKRGWPHAHLLLSAPKVSKHWLSRTWRELTGSYVVDLQNVSGHQHAARYLTKYLTKDPQVPPGQRRYRRSAGFFNAAEEPPITPLPVVGGWHRHQRHVLVEALLFLRQGYAIELQPDGHVRARDDPDEWARQIQAGLQDRIVRSVPPGLMPYADDRGFWE